MLLDSNIIVYAAQPEHADLRNFIAAQSPAVSAISVVEVLGYHQLSETERTHFEEFFGASRTLAVSDIVISEAVSLASATKNVSRRCAHRGNGHHQQSYACYA
jgi:predicted nucleic acid-binding protein